MSQRPFKGEYSILQLRIVEPLILSFDPDKTKDEGIRAVFKDEIARQLWMAIKSTHITNQYFNRQCLRAAQAIRKQKPATPEVLYLSIRVNFELEGDDIYPSGAYPSGTYESAKEFMLRLFAAVYDIAPLSYRIILPGTPEQKQWQRREKRRGYRQGRNGKPFESSSRYYLAGYTRGSNARYRAEDQHTRRRC
jgi:hypothetical protein